MRDNTDAKDIGGGSPPATDAFLRIDSSGRILESDKSAENIFPTEAGSLVGQEVWNLLPSASKSELHEEITRVEKHQVHATLETFDARYGAWFRYHIFLTQNGIILLITNLTALERRAAIAQDAASSREQHLETKIREESEKKDRVQATQDSLKMALTAAHMATVDYEIISGTFSFSEGIQEIFGVPIEAVPQTPSDLPIWLLPEDYEKHMAIVEAAVNAGEEYVSEFRIRNPVTKEVRWLENRGRAVRDEQGKPLRIQGIVQDISDRKQYQEELERRVEERTTELRAANRVLREAEERVDMALRNAPIAMSIVGRDLRYKWFYHPYLSHAEEYVGKTAESFLSKEDAAMVNALKQQVLNTGVGLRQEVCHVVAGRDICVDMSIEPMKNEAGDIEGVITVALDITERKRSEQKLRDLNVALERRAEQLRKLTVELTRTEEKERRRIAGILHDNLQQILVGEKLYVQTLVTNSVDSSMRSSLEKIQSMIDEAIAASRSLTAELSPPMLYGSGLPEALQWLASWVKEKHGLDVTVQSDKRSEEVSQDLRVVLFQAVRELLFNVVKHAQVKQANLTLCYGGEHAIAVRVRDEGVGYNPEANSISAIGGYGLMAIRERLAAMGGTMEIISSPGQGTTTTIKVPVHRTDPTSG